MSTPSQSTTIAIILTIAFLIIILGILIICWWHRLLCFTTPVPANSHNRWNFSRRLETRDRYGYGDGYLDERDQYYSNHRPPRPQGRPKYQLDRRDIRLPRYPEVCRHPGRERARGGGRWGPTQAGWGGARRGLEGDRCLYGCKR